MSRIDYSSGAALVTGASSGIGAEFARQLAARGSSLVVVARRADRLESLARELEAAHRVAVTVIPLDLAADAIGQKLFDEVAARGIDVHTVVNSAGFGGYGRFAEEPADRIREEIQLNVVALVDISRAFLPQLLRHGDGALINLASTAGFQPVPGMAVYASTKAFVLNFTEALWGESRSSGLKVLALCPGPVSTEFFDVVGTHDGTVGALQSADAVVRVALARLDKRDPGPSAIPGWRNHALTLSERFVSRRAVATTGSRSMKSPDRAPVSRED